MKKNIFILVFLIILITISVLFLYVSNVQQRHAEQIVEYSTENTPVNFLATKNKNFADALSFEKEKKYDFALLSYQKALLESTDDVQYTQIRLKIALMNEWLGNFTEAITQLKSIVSDTKSYNIARAYAVQEIAFMNIYSENQTRKTVFDETFKDLPYKSFVHEGNSNLTYTKLFEYATSIFPLGYSESYVAYGYSGELLHTLRRSTTTDLGIEYISNIKKSLSLANADITRMKNISGERGLVPVALAWQGVAVSRLASMGIGSPEDAEVYFKASLDYSSITNDRPGNFNTFNYVAYLVYYYGDTRTDDIKKLLSPYRIGNDREIYSQVVSFFKASRTDKNFSGDKKQIITMAQISPEFKRYLISLGWEDSDFVISK